MRLSVRSGRSELQDSMTRAHIRFSQLTRPRTLPNEPVSIRDDVVQHNILAAYYVMYRIFAVAQAGGAVPGGHA